VTGPFSMQGTASRMSRRVALGFLHLHDVTLGHICPASMAEGQAAQFVEDREAHAQQAQCNAPGLALRFLLPGSLPGGMWVDAERQ